MADEIAIPLAGEALVKADRTPETSWYRILAALVAAFNATTRALSDVEDTRADKDQTVGACYLFKFPEDETVDIVLKSPFGWTITSVTTKTEAGTSTVTVSIDGVSLGGSANAASTSEESQAHSTANVVAADADVRVNFASTSSDCENLSLTLKGTRTLD